LIGAMRAHRTQVHALETRPGEALAGWYALTNNDLKPIPTHAGLLLAPGWGTREGLASFLASLGAPIPAEHRGRPGRFYTGFLYIFALLSGIIVGFAGSFTHRASPPWGLVIGLVAVLAGAVMNRTTGSAKTAFTYAAGLVGSVLLITTVMRRTDRSEEHTSELQSRFDLVCRLLLEKKKRSGNEGVVDEGPIGHIRL